MRPKYYFFISVVIVITLVIIYSGYQSVLNNDTKAPNVVKTDTSIPNFTTKTIEGKEYTFNGEQGILVIEVFAEWCLPCRKSVPEAIEFAKNNQDVNVFGLAFRDVDFKTKEFLDEFGKFETTLKSNASSEKALGVTTVPQTLFIKDNKVLYRAYGITSSEDLNKILALVEGELPSS